MAVGAPLRIDIRAQALGWTTFPSPNDVPRDNYSYGADASGTSDVWTVGRETTAASSNPKYRGGQELRRYVEIFVEIFDS